MPRPAGRRQPPRLLRCHAGRGDTVGGASLGRSRKSARARGCPPAAIAGFGSETVKKKVDDMPKSMDSTIIGDFDGWGPNTRIKLANGQVWRVIDDSSAVLPRRSNPKVRIERNLFGTLFLSVEGTNSSAKVRRVE